MGMAVGHSVASGMGGIRTAGDLVARMQMSRGLKIEEAKSYVAKKLAISVSDLADPFVMNEVRSDLDIGMVSPGLFPGSAKGIEAKYRIAELLDIEINCVDKFKNRITRKRRT